MSDAQTEARPNLSRTAAAGWFTSQGFDHISVEFLEKAAAAGNGPPQFRIGKYVYYTRSALEAWLAAEIERGGRPRRRGAGAG